MMNTSILTLALGIGVTSTPGAEPPRGAAKPLDLELTGVVATPTVTGPTVGPDIAISLGRPELHLRLGMQVLGGPDRRLTRDGHRVGEIVETGTWHMCVARPHPAWRLRMCGGAQIGVTHLRWQGFVRPGRRAMPWGALTSFADLAIALGRRAGLEDDRLGLLFSGGMMLPVLGPAVVVRDGPEVPPRIFVPRSVGLTLGAGLRVSLR